MYRYDLSLGCNVMQKGASFLTSNTTWHNLDEDGLAAMIGFAKSVEAEVVKQSKKGGNLSITLIDSIVPLDGGPVPEGANGEVTYEGFDLHGLVKIEDAMADIAKQIAKMGKEHADKKAKK